MGKINVLPPDIVSKIAAGEVIERPASCVKELLENALDAGADAVELHIENAGRSLIRIRDNGSGIEADDLEKLFLRHSTSKLASAGDLYRIGTLGFRGEALYSIAAVADAVVKSKTATAESGWELHCRAGHNDSPRPVGFVRGTEIEIKELFFNTPARKKFLKQDTTEFNAILGVVIPYTLLYPRFRFSLTHNGRGILDLKPASSPAQRYADALRLNEPNLIHVHQDNADKGFSIELILGDINVQRPRKDLQFIFVNNRPVHNRAIAFHMNEAYKLIFPERAAPVFSAAVTIPPQDVDVNIHPSKREVKLKDEQAVASFCRHCAEQALMKHGAARQARERIFTFDKSEPLEAKSAAPAVAPQAQPQTQPQHVREPARETYQAASGIPETLLYAHDKLAPGRADKPLHRLLAAATFIGSFRKKYLLFDGGESLLFVDQHAAHERVTYERYKRQIERGKIEIQHLIAPELLRLTHEEMNAWQELKEKLEALGFTTTQWDRETVAVHTHPNLIPQAGNAVRNILAGEDIARCDPDTIARRACRQSLMTGRQVQAAEAENLRKELLACNDPFTCPHGRPTVIEIDERLLSKQFLR